MSAWRVAQAAEHGRSAGHRHTSLNFFFAIPGTTDLRGIDQPPKDEVAEEVQVSALFAGPKGWAKRNPRGQSRERWEMSHPGVSPGTLRPL